MAETVLDIVAAHRAGTATPSETMVRHRSLPRASTASQPGVGKTDRDPVRIRANFMRGIGAKK